jgi:hypothetical protein
MLGDARPMDETCIKPISAITRYTSTQSLGRKSAVKGRMKENGINSVSRSFGMSGKNAINAVFLL